MDWLLKTADRLESVYLAALRIVVLVLATLALLVALYIAGDGLRSLMTSTDVEAEPVSVSAAELTRAVAAKKDASDATDSATTVVSDAAKKEQTAFLNGPFAPYYRLYVASAKRFNKPEDTVLSASDLADKLGYGIADRASSPDATTHLFAADAAYRQQIIDAVKTAAAEPAQLRQLERYRSAQKTDKACRTVYELRRGWDSYSTGCDGWWQAPTGCPVVRQMPVEKCEPAYPADITSPVQAFANLDRGFREIWKSKVAASNDKAFDEEEKRSALKATGIPKLTRALVLLGLFLGVMFLFLVIAMERHLRKLKAVGAENS